MYKMLIADDEMLARYAFRTLVSKKFNNIEVVGEAESGREVISLNRELRPDIIIMDIKIPGINGLDASREILREFPETKILILTAYDNFSYIQQALDMGVRSYLLKPLDDKEIVDKINKIIGEINEGKNRSNIRENEESKISIVKPFIEKEIVLAFITGNFDIDEVKSYINFLQYRVEGGYFMLISPNSNYSSYIDDSVRNKIYLNRIFEAVEKHLPFMKKCIFGNPVGNVINVFFPIEKLYVEGEILKESMLIGNEIKRRIKIITDIEIAVGVGNVYKDIKEFKQSYDEASFALKISAEKSTIVHFNSIKNDFCCETPEYPVKMENEFLEQLRIGNIVKAKDLADGIMSCIFNNCNNNSIVKEYVSQFITIIKRNLWQMTMDSNLFKDVGVLTELNKLSELDELEVWCKRNISTLIQIVESNKQKKGNCVMNQVYEYIGKKLCKDVTLEMAAEQVGLSPQYLSKVFKEESGMNFIDYITHKRIALSKRLLEEENKNIKEVAAMVGYGDTNYFCRIFKKNTGLTPKQYRNRK